MTDCWAWLGSRTEREGRGIRERREWGGPLRNRREERVGCAGLDFGWANGERG